MDSVWGQENPEARKMLENGAESIFGLFRSLLNNYTGFPTLSHLSFVTKKAGQAKKQLQFKEKK